MKRHFLRGVSVFAVLTAGGVHAQEVYPEAKTAANEGSDAASRPTSELNTIIVTAQRREENLQDAAIAITAVSSDQLVRAGVTDTTQLTQVAPALQVGTVAGSANTFYLRGVGNFTTNAQSDAAVSFNVNGVPFARTQSAHGVFYDLDRVEVLKGPQGILYGKNSTGGAINVIPAKPRIGDLGGFVMGEYGNYDSYKATAALNIPVAENAAVRLSGNLTGRDGYYSDGTGDDETQAVRAQFAADIGDSISLLLGADYAHQGGAGAGATITGLDYDERIGLFDPRADAIYSSSFAFLAGTFLEPLPNEQFPPFNDNEFWGMFAQADIDTPIGTLTILPAYRKARLEQRSYAASFGFFYEMDSEQKSLEVRLASDRDGFLDYILGVFYQDEDTTEKPIYNQQFFVGDVDVDIDTQSYAAFGQLTFNLSERLRLSAGARYTVDDKRSRIDSLNIAVVCPAVFAGGACPGTPAIREDQVPGIALAPDGSVIPVRPHGPSGAILSSSRLLISPAEKFKKPTYRIGLEYDIAENSLLYATVETGFKSGGFFATIGDPVYDPETITSFTIGSKNRFFGNTVQLNVEAFYWKYKDQQVSHLGTNRLGGVEFVTENVGQTNIKGIELDGQFRVASNTTLFGTVQYLDAKYKDFVYFNPVGTGVPTSGCDITGPADGLYRVDCTGRRAPNAPEWTVYGGVEQLVPLGSGELILNLDARYQSQTVTGFEQLPSQLQDGYAIVNAQIAYEFADPQVSIAAFVNNLLDEEASAFSLPNPRVGSALVVQSLRPPRTYGVRLRYGF
jgi:iron complex outermembrane receptor protein